ncbi:PE-PGRS family protein [Dyadobacter flavalbus]|uniref:PE-PGRS family protein n=1 Tax=Dyadobacter flavalbus TaxID=2579942 RepID=A0A5M8R151_9BACT|nr:PE-PGRS family protein [Dyadobacter flavalbus]KAA6440714.1 PE-PGRS family protein [Dyadobacter flavalbus]
MKLYKRPGRQIGRVLSSLILLTLCSCDPDPDPETGSSESFESTPQQYAITPGRIDEASGLAPGKNLDGFLWTLQDSGAPNSLYLISSDGKEIREYPVPGTANHDWEDMAIGPGPKDGTHYLYIGDIGNNNKPVTLTNTIYRVPEIGGTNDSFSQNSVEKITFSYPDGARDAETLLLDAVTKDLFILSKEIGSTGIYRLPFPQSTSETMIAEKVGTVPSVSLATGGSISADGTEILIRTYLSVHYWKRKQDKTIGQTLSESALKQLSVAPEPQGEAICFDRESAGFYTLSEKSNSPGVSLNYYKRK